MDEGSSQKKTKSQDTATTAVNPEAVGHDVNSLSGLQSARVEKKIDELGAKLEKLSQQIRALQAPAHEQKSADSSANPDEPGKKPEGAPQAKAEDVIHVRKSKEFSFYS